MITIPYPNGRGQASIIKKNDGYWESRYTIVTNKIENRYYRTGLFYDAVCKTILDIATSFVYEIDQDAIKSWVDSFINLDLIDEESAYYIMDSVLKEKP